jgi:hypothetical protein
LKNYIEHDCRLCGLKAAVGSDVARYMGDYVHVKCKQLETTVTKITVVSGEVSEISHPIMRGAVWEIQQQTMRPKIVGHHGLSLHERRKNARLRADISTYHNDNGKVTG